MKYNLFFFLIIIFSCQQKKSNEVKVEKTLDTLTKIPERQIEVSKEIKKKVIDVKIDSLNIFPKDTVITSKYLFFFKQINKPTYAKLLSKSTDIRFKKDDSSEFLTKKDSCYYLSLKNSEKDTLCDFDDGEYHEKYTYKGFSKEKNTMLFDWENWEEAHSVLINLKQNKHWILCPNYKLSSNDKIVTYSNYIDNPIYERNEFFISEITTDSIKELYYNSNKEYGVFNSNWINEDRLIIHLKNIDYKKFTTNKSYFFEITVQDIL